MTNYQLKCKDIGFESCEFIATGNSESELRRKFIFHSIMNHDEDLNRMEAEEKIKLEELIKQILDEQSY